MPLIKSDSDKAFEENVSEMVNSRTKKGMKRRRLGKDKMRQMAVAAAFEVKKKAGGK